MSIGSLTQNCPGRRAGVALVIVLAFVVLLTGLIVAFFSRAMSERQISNASANSTKVDALAQGAMDTVIGDLKQEIVAGSTAFALSSSPSQGSNTLYIPPYLPNPASASPLPATAMVPALVPAARISQTNGLENLVKQSAGGEPFYKNSAGANTALTYNTSAYPPSTRAASGQTANSYASPWENSSAKPSLNGRYVSPARWNKPLLLPATSGTDATPSVQLITPDWVLVARDGSNPLSWSSGLITSGTNTTSVVGRFAYNVYDEGGLLDANVAGFPAAATSSSVSATTAGPYGYYKNALAYADLTQLKDAAGNQLLNQSQIDALVGWRNSASANAPGAFPNPAFGDPSRTSYYNSILTNPFGFLRVGIAPLSGSNKQSDRMFASRQSLISLMQTIAAQIPGNGTAKVQDSLRFLGTFSRGLSQPSYLPTQATDNSKPGYDSTSPVVLAQSTGGNNATGLDAVINPTFLNVRVPSGSTFVRGNGVQATAGEPLVLRRFALNRIAWLTYAGPIAGDGGNLNPMGDAGVAMMITAYENQYGIPESFLKQGTAANIRKYFGLSWDPSASGTNPGNFWRYNVHNGSTGTGPTGSIMKLGDIATLNGNAGHEPDFFELLKAAVKVGSLAKPGTTGTSQADAFPPVLAQYTEDIRVDDAIIQMGANIIDQFDLDNYPTRIAFDDGGGQPGTAAPEFDGVENLPYLSQVQNGIIKAVAPDTGTGGPFPYNNGGTVGSTIPPLNDTGLGVFMQTPVLWNPHDWSNADATAVNRTLGVTGPGTFRLYAVTDPNTFVVVTTSPSCFSANDTSSPGYKTKGFPWSGESRSLTVDNTAMTFQITHDATGAQLFREPTALFRTGKPTGSNLACNAFTNLTLLDKLGQQTQLFQTGANAGIMGQVGGQAHPVTAPSPYTYIGVYLGTHPLVWKNAAPTTTATTVYRADYTTLNAGLGGTTITYYLQYQNAAGNWVTYDKKPVLWGDPAIGSPAGEMARGMRTQTGGYLCPRWPWERYAIGIDPRTNRFNFISTALDGSTRFFSFPPFYGDEGVQWISPEEGIFISPRSGKSIGVTLQVDRYFQAAAGFYPGNWSWNGAGSGTQNYFRAGLLSQNVIRTPYGNQPVGDGEGHPYLGPTNASPAAQFYSDADGVVRRAMGGLTSYPAASAGADPEETLGLPMRTANQFNTLSPVGLVKTQNGTHYQSDSRPMILNRPFQSSAELGYTFSGIPWKNINFFQPESGESALLDIFCINDTDDAAAKVAGCVNLNTRQTPVLSAILAGAYRDELLKTDSNGQPPTISTALANAVSAALVSRTTNPSNVVSKGPLRNVSDLVGKWVSRVPVLASGANAAFDPASYDGFSADLSTVLAKSGSVDPASTEDRNIPRYRSATVRALTNCGQTRVWNLMIDVIAQTGRYPSNATALDKFQVEAEQRYWIHVAIDRLTGDVIDKQVEVVKE